MYFTANRGKQGLLRLMPTGQPATRNCPEHNRGTPAPRSNKFQVLPKGASDASCGSSADRCRPMNSTQATARLGVVATRGVARPWQWRQPHPGLEGGCPAAPPAAGPPAAPLSCPAQVRPAHPGHPVYALCVRHRPIQRASLGCTAMRSGCCSHSCPAHPGHPAYALCVRHRPKPSQFASTTML